MSNAFLAELMRFAVSVTGTERGLAVNRAGEVVAQQNITDEELHDSEFTGFQNIRQAYETGEAPHITNNMILNPDMAPNTNTNFANLRMVVVFTLDDLGAIYIDQHVRMGVVPRPVAERIMGVMMDAASRGQMTITSQELTARYEQT